MHDGMTDTWTPQGMKKELDKRIDGYIENGNTAALVRLVGGSAADFDERYDPISSGGHPREN